MIEKTILDRWHRKHFQPGGGSPFLFYVLYGQVPADIRIAGPKYSFDHIPDGLSVMQYGPENHPEVVDEFRNGYLWDQFIRSHPKLSTDVTASQHCTIVRGEFADESDLH